MTEPETSRMLGERAHLALGDAFLRKAVRFTADRLRNAKAAGTASLDRWEEWRERGRAVRAHTIRNLDFYLQQFQERCEAAGGRVHFAADAAEAARIAIEIARASEARLLAKSKSMVTEEIELNHELEAAGLEALETDLGEWIVQLARETPSHIILPAIHKSRAQIQALFQEHGGAPLADDTRTLAAYARKRLREKFLAADIGVSGCNFAIADTGSIAMFTNEGNGRMVTTLPRVHAVFMGLERIVPTWADLELMVELLPRSATGQKITTYLNVITGPARDGEADGPRELHVIVLDNGRSRQLGDPHFEPILSCIRCGACLNVCPVYRQIGGHAYGSVYPGPIGAVLTPLLEPESPRATELADASSLCGACTETCPVKIPLHDMLVIQRQRNVAARRGTWLERAGFRLSASILRSPRLYSWAGRIARFVVSDSIRPRGWRERVLRPIAGWTRHRDLPAAPKRSFREQWDESERERRAR